MPATITNYATLTAAIGDWSHRANLITGSPPLSDYFIQAAQEQFEKDILDENFGNGIYFQENFYAPTLITGGVAPVPSDWAAPKLMTVTDDGGNVWPLIFKAPTWIYDTYPVRQATDLPAYIAADLLSVAVFTATLNVLGVLNVTLIDSGIVQTGMILSDNNNELPGVGPGSAVIVTGQSSGNTGAVGYYTAQSCSPLGTTYNTTSETMQGGSANGVFIFGPYPDGPYQIQGTYYQQAPLLSQGGASSNWMTLYAPMTLLAYCMVACGQFVKDAAMVGQWQTLAQAGCKGLVDKDKARRWAASTMQVEVG